jgi:transcriptional regulator with XRE-family HTH domain
MLPRKHGRVCFRNFIVGVGNIFVVLPTQPSLTAALVSTNIVNRAMTEHFAINCKSLYLIYKRALPDNWGSQKQFGDKMGIHRSTVSQICAGTYRAGESSSLAGKVAAVTGIGADKLQEAPEKFNQYVENGHPSADGRFNVAEKEVEKAACTLHCKMALLMTRATVQSDNDSTTDVHQILARQIDAWRIHGDYKIIFRLVNGSDNTYRGSFRKCVGCKATLFKVVTDHDEVPLTDTGFALLVGDMLSVYMIGGRVHWTFVCHVTRQLDTIPLTGIFLDPNPRVAQVQGNKILLIKCGTTAEGKYTDDNISRLLDNDPTAANGTLVSARL